MRAFIEGYAEDVALTLGATSLAVGVGMAFGIAYALITLGVELLAYGVWISPRSEDS